MRLTPVASGPEHPTQWSGQLPSSLHLAQQRGLAETFGPALIEKIGVQAPGVTLHFLTKADKEGAPLRKAEVNLETGVIDEQTAPELRATSLFELRERIILQP